MFRTVSEMKTESRENMRGGKGNINITHIFKQDEFTGKCRLCARVVIQPGDNIGFHEHNNEEEIYVITKGVALVNDDGIEKQVTAGDAVLTGNGKGHSIKNIGNEPLELLAIILLYT